MAGISWVKLSTGIFDDPKIKMIMKKDRGYECVLFFINLIALAGKENNSGVFCFGDMPYCDADFACITGFDDELVNYALNLFMRFNMVSKSDDGVISICNWEKHQNEDGLSKIRKQTSERVKKHRDKKKDSPSIDENNCNADVTQECNVTVTQCNATEEDKEEDKDKDYDKRETKKTNSAVPTLEQVQNECKKLNLDVCPQTFFNMMSATGWTSNGSPIRDWQKMLLVWQQRETDYRKSKGKKSSQEQETQTSYDIEEYMQRSIGLKYEKST